MTKICLLTHEFYPKRGGAGIYCEEIAKAASNLGFKLKVFVPETRVSSDWISNYEVLSMPYKQGQGFWNRKKTQKVWLAYRSQLQDSILHIAEPAAMIPFLAYPSLLKNLKVEKYLLTFHGSEILKFWRKYKKNLSSLIDSADKITVISPYVGDLLKKHFVFDPNKLSITPGAPRFLPNLSDLKDRGTEEIIIACVARLHPRKGQLALLEALSLLNSSLQKRLKILFIGQKVNTRYANQLKKFSENLKSKVEFLDSVSDEDLHSHLVRAHIFAMTSMPAGESIEGLGLSYLEASAYQLPILAHDIGGVKFAVLDRISGILVPPTDRVALSQKLKSLILSEKMRIELGQNGRKLAEKLSWEAIARETYR